MCMYVAEHIKVTCGIIEEKQYRLSILCVNIGVRLFCKATLCIEANVISVLDRYIFSNYTMFMFLNTFNHVIGIL